MRSESIVWGPSLAPDGHRKIDWAAGHSLVLNTVRDRYLKDGTFEGLGVALPIEVKTSYLTVVLAEAGADVAVARVPGVNGRAIRVARCTKIEGLKALHLRGVF